MSDKNIFGYLAHTVVVCAEGGNTELLLCRLMASGITPKQVNAIPYGLMFTLSARSYKSLHTLRKGTGCKVYLLRKSGPLFLFKRLYRRRSLAVAAVLFFVTLYLLSGLIWRIDTGALSREDATIVKSMLYTEGIHPGSVANSEHLRLVEQKILMKSDRFAYLKLNFSDGRLQVEATLPNNYIDINSGSEPLYAAFDGIVHSIEVYEGYAMVKVNQSVSEGEKLVDNIKLNRDNEPVSSQVYASVTAYTCASYTRAEPLEQEIRVLTGDYKTRYALSFLSLHIPFYLDAQYDEGYQRATSITPLTLLGFKLPITVEKTELYETEWREITLTPEQASLNAQQDIAQQLFNDYSYPVVLEKKVSSQEGEDSILITVDYEIIANFIKN